MVKSGYRLAATYRRPALGWLRFSEFTLRAAGVSRASPWWGQGRLSEGPNGGRRMDLAESYEGEIRGSRTGLEVGYDP